MTELQSLFVILVVVYMTQCVSWVAPHASVFSRNYRGKWREGAPELDLSAWKTKGALANLLPFFFGIVVASPEPLALTPKAILPAAQPNSAPGAAIEATPQLLPFTEVKKITVHGERVSCNGREIHRATSAPEARLIAAHIRALAKLRQDARGTAIEKELKRQFDTSAIHARIEEYRKATRWVARISNLLFVVLFVIVPAYILVGVITLAWLALLFVTILIIAVLTRSFLRAHRKLHPDDGDSRWTDTLTVALSPFAAIRSRDALARNLLTTFDPLAIACVLLPPTAFRARRSARHSSLALPRFAASRIRIRGMARSANMVSAGSQPPVGKLLEGQFRGSGEIPEAAHAQFQRVARLLPALPQSVPRRLRRMQRLPRCSSGEFCFGGTSVGALLACAP